MPGTVLPVQLYIPLTGQCLNPPPVLLRVSRVATEVFKNLIKCIGSDTLLCGCGLQFTPGSETIHLCAQDMITSAKIIWPSVLDNWLHFQYRTTFVSV